MKMKQLFLIFALLTGILGQTTYNITKVITLSIYYTSSSTSSKSFISKQLVPTYKILNKYTKLDFVPSGNETVELNPDGNLSFYCTRDPFDCIGNQIQGCALQKLEHDALKLQFVDCFMQLSGNFENISLCIKEVKLDMEEIYACLKNSGSTILSNYIARTKKELPDLKDLKYMPHLKFDGKTVSDSGNDGGVFKIICSLLENVPECKDGAHLIIKRQTKPKPPFDGIKTFDITDDDKTRMLNILKTKDENVRTYNINADNDKHLKETLTRIISGFTNSNKKHKREATVETLSNDTIKIVSDNINDLTKALHKYLVANSKDEEIQVSIEEDEELPEQDKKIMHRSLNKKFYHDEFSKFTDIFPELRRIFALRNNNKEENSTKFYTGRSPQKKIEYEDYVVQLPPQLRKIMADAVYPKKKEPSAKYFSEDYKQFHKAEVPNNYKYFMSPENAETKEDIDEYKDMSQMSECDEEVIYPDPDEVCSDNSISNNTNSDDIANNDGYNNDNYTKNETASSDYMILNDKMSDYADFDLQNVTVLDGDISDHNENDYFSLINKTKNETAENEEPYCENVNETTPVVALK